MEIQQINNAKNEKKEDKTILISKILKPLLFYINYNLKIWIPLKENIEIADYLKSRNFNVEGFYDGVNFLSTSVVMTNYIFLIPQTNELNKYLYKAFMLGIPFAMLIPLYSLADEKVQNVLRSNANSTQILFIKTKYLFNTKLVPSIWICSKILPNSIEFE